MNKVVLNFWLDVLLFVNFLAITATGAILRWGVACGRGCREREFWGWFRSDWLDLHFYLAIAIVVNISLHIVLHWDWVVCQIKKCRP